MRRWITALLVLTLLLGCGHALAEEETLPVVYATLADAGVDLEALLAEVPKGAGNDDVFTNSQGLEVAIWGNSVEVRGDGSDFDSLSVNLSDGSVTLGLGSLSMRYGADGVIESYTLQYSESAWVTFTPYGMPTRISGSGYDDSLLRTGRYPVTIVGEIPGALTPPDVQVYGTVDGALVAAGLELNVAQFIADVQAFTEQAKQLVANMIEAEDENLKKSVVRFSSESGVTLTIHFSHNQESESVTIARLLIDHDLLGEVRIELNQNGELERVLPSNIPASAAPLSSLRIGFMDGQPDSYRLEYAEHGVIVRYDAEGLLEGYSYGVGDGNLVNFWDGGTTSSVSSDMDSSCALYPPLKVIGEVETVLLTPYVPAAPEVKVYATLALAGVDPAAVTDLVPADIGLTVEGGVITIPDNGYLTADVYHYDAGQYFNAELVDGLWVIDCGDMRLNDDSCQMAVVMEAPDGNRMVLYWLLEDRPGQATLRGSYDEDGAYTELSVTYFSDTAYILSGHRVNAFYNEAGDLTDYYYTVGDQMARFHADNTFWEMLTDGDPADFPPLELVTE